MFEFTDSKKKKKNIEEFECTKFKKDIDFFMLYFVIGKSEGALGWIKRNSNIGDLAKGYLVNITNGL